MWQWANVLIAIGKKEDIVDRNGFSYLDQPMLILKKTLLTKSNTWRVTASIHEAIKCAPPPPPGGGGVVF